MKTKSLRKFDKCPRCSAKLKKATAYSGAKSQFWYECTKCNTYVNSYIPQHHQQKFHEDPHRYLGNFGAYGTGKTLTTRAEVYKHAFITPDANILIGANVTSQYEQTIKREIENDIPQAFVTNTSARYSYIDLQNSARIMYRPLDKEGKLRSLNLTMFAIIEASEADGDTFHQLKTRLRNTSASKQATDPETDEPLTKQNAQGVEIPIRSADWRKGIIESNPDSGWIRTDVLLASDTISKYGEVFDQYPQDPDHIDPSTATHVSSTGVNDFLPEGYIQELCKNKPSWWVDRYIKGSFSYAEGLVYPLAIDRVVEPYEIPKNWKRIVAHDYGLSDNATFLFGAIDQERSKLVIYKEAVTNNRNIEKLAKLYHTNTRDIPEGGLYCSPIIDPKSGRKRDYNKKTLLDHYLDYNINFEPGHINLDARIYRLNTYIETNALEIFNTCTNLIEELKNYKFPEKSLTASRHNQDKPIDKDNHCINPLEWIVMELPSRPGKIATGRIYDSQGKSVEDEVMSKHLAPWEYDNQYVDEGFGAPTF
jgi:phage terminase large subunit